MKKPKEVLKLFEKYSVLIDKEIKELLESQERHLMYNMMSYFFGFKDENLKDIETYGGKRFRSGLCLLLADFYGKLEKAMEFAASIEIFHNFTLIHDDVEDRDPLRRGRPAVWRLWGINHAINTGDAQLVLANMKLASAVKNNPELSSDIQETINKHYLEVAEGQFLDFTLSELPVGDKFVTEENYMKMITKKSAVLVAVAAKAAGMACGLKKEEINILWDYGFNLGLAYQLSDDLASIWASTDQTGKVEANDLEEKKKTLPIIYLYKKLKETDQAKFKAVYNQERELTHNQISEIKGLLSQNQAHDYVWGKIRECAQKSQEAIEKLSLSLEQKRTLISINNALIPNMKWWDA